jgi:membrane protein DedA with SNARE-associated domain
LEGEFFRHVQEYLSRGESAAGLLLLFASSLLEYLFPPFPGDSVVLFGAFLAAWAGWSPWSVLLATLMGALAGAWIDTLAGRALKDFVTGRKEFSSPWAGRLFAFVKRPSFQEGVRKVMDKLRRHGTVIILVNRFFPGIRALFFVGAGMAGLPMGRVLLLGGLSAMLWNAAIFTAGFQVGRNWNALVGLFNLYTKVVYVLLGAAVVVAVVIWIVRRRKG